LGGICCDCDCDCDWTGDCDCRCSCADDGGGRLGVDAAAEAGAVAEAPPEDAAVVKTAVGVVGDMIVDGCGAAAAVVSGVCGGAGSLPCRAATGESSRPDDDMTPAPPPAAIECPPAGAGAVAASRCGGPVDRPGGLGGA